VIALREEQQNRVLYSLMAAEQDFPTAVAMGWAFVDETALPNSEYRYELRFLDAGSTEAKRAVTVVSTVLPPPLPTPALSVIPGDHLMTLRWEKADLEKHYNSYAAERSTDNGASWQPANTKPIVFLSTEEVNTDAFYYQDSLAQNDQTTLYRLRGKTSFGDYGPYSANAAGMGQNAPVPGIQVSLKTLVTPDNKVRLDWTLPQDLLSRIAHLRVLRAPDRNKNFIQISGNLPPTQTNFLDPAPGPANYYIVEAVDEYDHPHQSIPVLGQPNDNTPPLPPPAPQCTCDTKGNVLVRWQPSPSSDVMGYRVYRSNVNQVGELMQVTTDWTADTFFAPQ
jgi:uncharacterized protein